MKTTEITGKLKHIAVPAAFLTILLSILVTPVISDDTTPIPEDKSQLNSWFNDNIQPYTASKATLDPELVVAEEGVKIIKVRKDGSGDYRTVNEAIRSIEPGNKKRVIVSIGGGDYDEKILIPREKPFVTLCGSPDDMPNLKFGGTALQYGTVDSATLVVESDYFTAANLIITNSSPRPNGIRKGAQAVALRISGDKAAFYNCKIYGFQDTLCDDKGKHFYKDCFIEGTVDFIYGNAKSLYLNTELHAVQDKGFSFITAQARESPSQDTGYSFVHCAITGTGNSTYLGRAWRPNSLVVYAYTDMGSVVNPEGWSDDFHKERDKTVFYGEYKCSGAGSTPDARAKFSKQLSDADAKPFLSLAYIQGSKWLLPPPKV